MNPARIVRSIQRQLAKDRRNLLRRDRELRRSHKVWYLPNGVDRETLDLLHRVTATWQPREGEVVGR
jgi:hypothetical protein